MIWILLMITVAGFAQKREKRSHQDFTKISFAVPGNAYVKQGSAWSVELEADAEVLDRVETKVENGKLLIRVKPTLKGRWTWNNGESVTARITLPVIEAISVAGSGDLKGEGRFKTGNLEVKVAGSGSATLEVESADLDLSVAGSGDIRIKGRMKNIDTSVSGSGNIDLEADSDGNFSGTISGSGKINAKGKARSADLSISGSGEVHAYGLTVAKCSARISGSGDVEVTATDDIDATISGSGSVTYKGDPKHVNSHSSGSGKVKRAEN